MAQLTLYLDEQVAAKMKAAAKAAGMSYSRWVTKLIEDEIRDQWPQNVANLAGAWADLPSTEELRANEGKDIPREAL